MPPVDPVPAELSIAGEMDVADPEVLSEATVRRRASAGVFLIASSSVANLLLGFFGNLVLARLLTPHDFGLVAVGSTALLLGGALTEGGLGIGMIRRSQAPTAAELRALNGIQLTIALAIFLPAALVALAFGTVGLVTAIMLASLPITTLQTPGRVLLLRRMHYQRQAIVDLGSQIASLAVPVIACSLGAGVWGLAAGTIAKAVAAVVITAIVSIGLHAPSVKGWRAVGGLMRFGLAFQTNWIVLVVRSQVLNAVIAALGGVRVLGLWWLISRLTDVPSVLFTSLSGVSFPAMANYVARGEDPWPMIPRVVRLAAVASSLLFVPFAAAAPDLIPTAFGKQWIDAGTAIPYVALGALIGGPISVGVCGYLFAVGRVGAVVRASIVVGVVWVGTTAALLPVLGITAIGIGAIASSLAEAVYLDRITVSAARLSPARSSAPPIAIAALTGALGVAIGRSAAPSVPLAVVAATVGELACLAGLWLICRRDLQDTLRTAFGTVRDALHRSEAVVG